MFSLCAFHVTETARLLLQERDVSKSSLQHLSNPKKTRLKTVREVLQTTVSGRELLQKVQGNDILLEKMLKTISNLIEEKNSAIKMKMVILLNIIFFGIFLWTISNLNA